METPREQIQVDPREEAELRKLLASFVLAYLKAMNLTGYYPPDHPSVKGVAEAPHKLMQRLNKTTTEVVFLTPSGGASQDVQVEGGLSNPISLEDLILSSMGDVFARKFMDYLDRAHLVAFTIKTNVPKDEFNRFIALMAETHTRGEEAHTEEEIPFSRLLVQKRILHISAVHRDELVGTHRHMPWRVRIAISRLRKDLTTLPLYSEASHLELQAAKTQLISDIVRPLRQARLLRDLLVNADMIRSGVKELTTVDVEGEIISCLHSGILLLVAWDMVSALEQASWGVMTQVDGARERRIDTVLRELLQRIAIRLIRANIEKTYELLEHLFDKEVVKFKELPKELQRVILTRRWTDRYLQSETPFLTKCKVARNAGEYEQCVRIVPLVLPELLVRDEWAAAGRLYTTLRDLVSEPDPTEIPQRADSTLSILKKTLTNLDLVQQLVAAAAEPDPLIRGPACTMLLDIDETGVNALVSILLDSDDTTVRREIAILLEEKGPEIHVPLMEVLMSPGRKWFQYRNAIMLLGRVDCIAAIEDIKRFTSYPDHRVREQCLVALVSLSNEDAEETLLKALKDRHDQVAARAIILLSQQLNQDKRFLNVIADLFQDEEQRQRPNPPSQTLLLAGLTAIRRLGVFPVSGEQTIIDLLLDAAMPPATSRLKKVLKRNRKTSFPPQVRAAICQVIGKIAGPEAVTGLTRIRQDENPEVREATDNAITTTSRRRRAKTLEDTVRRAEAEAKADSTPEAPEMGEETRELLTQLSDVVPDETTGQGQEVEDDRDEPEPF